MPTETGLEGSLVPTVSAGICEEIAVRGAAVIHLDVPPDREPRMKAWYLYLLECTDGSIYTGITVDVAKRYAAHAAGRGARYTRSHPPVRLLASIEYADRSMASKAEYAMKKLSAAQKRRAAKDAAKRSRKKRGKPAP